MVDYTNVSARAMIVTLQISAWRAQCFDREISNEVTDNKHAARDTARVNKHLFGTRRKSSQMAPEFAAVHDAKEALYQFHIANTLPWGNNGERLLPTANYFKYTDGVRKLGAVFNDAAEAFVDSYARLRDEAEARLGDLSRSDDFPGKFEVRRKFGWSMDVGPVPTAGDVRVDLPSDQVAEIEAKLVARSEAAARAAMEDAWSRLHEAVARIRKAAGKDGVVRGTLIDNAREVCDLLGRLNISQDEHLEKLRKRVEVELTTIAVEDLRKDDRLRADTEKRAAKIMSAMSAFYAPSAE